MCRVLGASRSGFYRGCTHRSDAKRGCVLDDQVAACFKRHKGRYGAPRLAAYLKTLDHAYDRKTVAKSLRRQSRVAKAGSIWR